MEKRNKERMADVGKAVEIPVGKHLKQGALEIYMCTQEYRGKRVKNKYLSTGSIRSSSSSINTKFEILLCHAQDRISTSPRDQ